MGIDAAATAQCRRSSAALKLTGAVAADFTSLARISAAAAVQPVNSKINAGSAAGLRHCPLGASTDPLQANAAISSHTIAIQAARAACVRVDPTIHAATVAQLRSSAAALKLTEAIAADFTTLAGAAAAAAILEVNHKIDASRTAGPRTCPCPANANTIYAVATDSSHPVAVQTVRAARVRVGPRVDTASVA